MKLADVEVKPGGSLDLAKVCGKTILRVEGRASAEFGKNTMVFQLNKIVFTDGTALFLEGEHDHAYIPSDKGLTQELLLALYNEQNK